MREYRITAKSQFQNYWTFFWYVLIASIFVAFMVFYQNKDFDYVWPFVVIILLSQFIPQLALHLDYYFVNKGDTLHFDDSKNKIIFTSRKNTVEFYLYNIQSIIRYRSFAAQKGNWELLTVDSYYHAIILLDTGAKIIVTSLLMPQFELPIDESKITVKMGLYRWAIGPSLKKV